MFGRRQVVVYLPVRMSNIAIFSVSLTYFILLNITVIKIMNIMTKLREYFFRMDMYSRVA